MAEGIQRDNHQTKEIKLKGNIAVLLYTKSFQAEEVRLLEGSYSEVASSVILPMQMADVINLLTQRKI